MKRLVSICFISLLLLMICPRALAQQTFDWELARPSDFVGINERVDSAYSDGVATVGLGVNIHTYYENDAQLGGRDAVGFMIAATANTREIITYDVSTTSYKWYDVAGQTHITGDDESRKIYFAYPVRFYGGRRSAEYDQVYVCSNGFITFDSYSTDKYYQGTIPSEDGPDAFIAPFWTDLKPDEDSSITYGYVDAIHGYVISWNDVPNKYGTRQTFQVVIELAPGSPDIYRNSRIWFNYQSITLDDDTTVGIEDQRGLRGVSYNYQNLGNSMTLRFRQTSNYAFIQYLTIKLNRGGDQYARIDIDDSTDWIRGENIDLVSNETDPLVRWAFALAGASALLLELTPWGLVQTAGFILGTTLVGIDIAEALAYSLSPAEYVEIVDDIPTPQPESYIKVAAVGRSFDSFTCVDAALGIRAWWLFTDPNNDQDHALTITAELTYAVYDGTGALVAYETIPTSVDLSVFIAEYLQIDYSPHGNTNPASGLHAYHHGSPVTVNASANPGYTFQWWLLDETTTIDDNPITVTMDSNHTLYPHFQYIGSGGGGGGGGGEPPRDTIYSPTLFVWNGSDYVKEVTLDLHGDSDVTVWHTIEQLLVPEDDHYLLSLRELNESISHIDYVKLYAVDTEGEMYEHHLTYAVHNELENVKQLLLFDDNNRVNLGPSHIIDLKFNAPEIENTAYLIFKIQGYEPT